MKILVAMSGGVDSAVAALLLKEQGHEVVGMTMRVHDDPQRLARAKSCCAPRDIGDARDVALALNIPYYVIDLREEFKTQVIDQFAEDYLSGRTPNPCVKCNSGLKFGALFQRARALGLEAVATGHYARIAAADDGSLKLLRAVDANKDQSYFLFGLTQTQLQHTVFPLGDLTKAQVRSIARRANLPVADKIESQEICFVPDNDYAKVVAHTFPERVASQGGGRFVDEQGRELAEHAGVHHFTVGQRRGLGLSQPRPLYVLGIDAKNGQVKVGPSESLMRQDMWVREVNWLGEMPAENGFCDVSIRYRHRAARARVMRGTAGRVQVVFDEQQRAVAPGQAAVFYRGDEVLGGGWIEA